MVHTGITSGCATCHETGKSFSGVTIVTRPTPAMDPAHPPTGDCSSCHTSTTSFTTGVTGKPANHIPTTAACTLCHLSLPGTYKPGTMNHTGIATGCTTCHAASVTGTPFYGVTPKPQGTGHIPTTADCATCHKSTTAFGPGTLMVHTGITSGCATCHDTGKSFTGVTNLKTKPTNHVPTTATCETCHSATNFTTFAGTAMNHSGIASGLYDLPCRERDRDAVLRGDAEAAGDGPHPDHGGLRALPQVHHGVRSGNADGAHRITSGCATCHETGKSFYGVTIVTRPTPAADPAHPPTGDCGGCHSSTTSFTTGVTAQAGESHSDHGGVHAVPPESAGLLQAGDDEPHRDHAAAARPATQRARPGRRSMA